jgi:hypothetical protein
MDSFTCHKCTTCGAPGFTSLPKEVMLQIFITIKNKSTLVEFEPMNLGSNGKHAAGKCKTIRKWQRNPALINKD